MDHSVPRNPYAAEIVVYLSICSNSSDVFSIKIVVRKVTFIHLCLFIEQTCIAQRSIT